MARIGPTHRTILLHDGCRHRVYGILGQTLIVKPRLENRTSGLDAMARSPRPDDPDETEGRRAQADGIARAQMTIAKRKVRLVEAESVVQVGYVAEPQHNPECP